MVYRFNNGRSILYFARDYMQYASANHSFGNGRGTNESRQPISELRLKRTTNRDFPIHYELSSSNGRVLGVK